MSARLLEYAVDAQSLDLNKEQMQLMHSIITGRSHSSSSSSSSCGGGYCDDDESAWMLQVGCVNVDQR
jgi:hypothetical protein